MMLWSTFNCLDLLLVNIRGMSRSKIFINYSIEIFLINYLLVGENGLKEIQSFSLYKPH